MHIHLFHFQVAKVCPVKWTLSSNGFLLQAVDLLVLFMDRSLSKTVMISYDHFSEFLIFFQGFCKILCERKWRKDFMWKAMRLLVENRIIRKQFHDNQFELQNNVLFMQRYKMSFLAAHCICGHLHRLRRSISLRLVKILYSSSIRLYAHTHSYNYFSSPATHMVCWISLI